jgi:hypothetical protein
MESKQTAVEWLIEQIKAKALSIRGDKMDNRRAKGAYVDCIIMAKEAQKLQKKQAFEFWQGGIACTEEGGKSFEQYYTENYGN